MKRDEMIIAISDLLSSSENINYLRDVKNEFALAREILDLIEAKGMLPPTDDEKSFTILDSGELTYQINEWEPE